MADQVLYSGVACITDLMVKEGLINLDFADVRSVMREMGKAMMGTGEASGEGRAMAAAEAAIANPLLDETSMKGAKGLLISITGGRDLTLFEVDEAATRIREEVDQDANIILGATFDEELEGIIRVSVVATGIDKTAERDRRRADRRSARHRRSRSRVRPRRPGEAPRVDRGGRSGDRGDPHGRADGSAADPVGGSHPPGRSNAVAMAAPPEVVQPRRRISCSRSKLLSRRLPAEAAAGRAAAQPQPVQRVAAQQPAGSAASTRMPRVEDFSPVGQGRGGGKGPSRGRPENSGADRPAQAADQRSDAGARKSPPVWSRRSRASRSCASRRRKPAGSTPGSAALRAAPRPARRSRPSGAAGPDQPGRRSAGDSGVPSPAGQLNS